MKNTASLQGVVPTKGTEYRAEFLAKFNEIRVDLLKIVGDDPESGDSTLSAVETQSGEIYTRIPDMYPVGQIAVML